MKERLPLALFVAGMAVEAYFLPWLFVAQLLIWWFFFGRKSQWLKS